MNWLLQRGLSWMEELNHMEFVSFLFSYKIKLFNFIVGRWLGVRYIILEDICIKNCSRSHARKCKGTLFNATNSYLSWAFLLLGKNILNKMHAKHILFIVGYSSNALIKCIKSGDILTQLIKEVSCKGRVTQEYTRRILVSLRGLWWEVIGISWVG